MSTLSDTLILLVLIVFGVMSAGFVAWVWIKKKSGKE